MRIHLIMTVLLLAGCAPSAERGAKTITQEPKAEANEAVGIYTQHGRPLTWAITSLPIEFRFAPEVPEYLTSACRRAAETFNAAAGHPLFRFADGPGRGPGLITFGRERPIDADEVGLAHTTYIDGHIIAAHLDFVPARLPSPTLLGGRWGADAEAACLHELGHALGFTHRAEATSIMFPYEMPPYHKRDLSTEDRARLLRYYGR